MKVVKQKNYKVGDKVKIINEWTDNCGQNFEGKMDKWLGKVMTIKSFDGINYRMEEDSKWVFNVYSIEGKVVEELEKEVFNCGETYKSKIVAVVHSDYNLNAMKGTYYFKTNDDVKPGDYVYCDTKYGLMVCVVINVYSTIEELLELKDLPELKDIKECRSTLKMEF